MSLIEVSLYLVNGFVAFGLGMTLSSVYTATVSKVRRVR